MYGGFSSLLRVAGYLETQRVLFGIESLTELAGEIYRKEHASLNARRGSRGNKRTWIAVSKIAQEIRLDVTFRKELRIAAETWLPCGKELLIHLGVIEAGHRPAVEAERSCGEDQVSALQAGISLGGHLDQLRITLKQLP